MTPTSRITRPCQRLAHIVTLPRIVQCIGAPTSWYRRFVFGALWLAILAQCRELPGQVLDQQRLLEAETFWDNRDWDWYRANIPFFECPDAEVNTTYYYRWELVTKHLTYGSPSCGYSFTEFIDRPFWSGAYGAISCPAGHQLYEVRWLKNPRYARDYARYWFRTPGAQPRRYSTWLADAAWAVHQVHPHDNFIADLLPDMVRNYEGWEQEHFAPDVGLFWQTGHDDGMEYNINSRQTQDIVAGAPGYRPTLNAYMWADALAIARVAELAGEQPLAEAYRAKASRLKERLQEKLWDPRRKFFLHAAKQDEEREEQVVRAMMRTYESGRFAGDGHGRELIGYVPWQFKLPDAGYEAAWKLLMDREHFFADFGPMTVERRDPQFFISPTCCWWSGQSWPYATTQTLKAMANLLQGYEQSVVTQADYFTLLKTYAHTHRKGGRPYIAEAAHPDNGSWDGHDSYNHSEHYFHSGYCDLIITGLVGVLPRDDDVLELAPLAPEEWEYFALDDLPYHGRRIAIVWDKSGERYRRGAGLTLLVDGQPITHSPTLSRLSARLPSSQETGEPPDRKERVNYAVNNDGIEFPRATASFTNAQTPIEKLFDGNYWYHLSPPNRWTCEGSPHAADTVEIDFGAPRTIDEVKLYFLDDGASVLPPASYELQYLVEGRWSEIEVVERVPAAPAGRRANRVRFPARETARIRVTFQHAPEGRTGLSEIEAWGDARSPEAPAAKPQR